MNTYVCVDKNNWTHWLAFKYLSGCFWSSSFNRCIFLPVQQLWRPSRPLRTSRRKRTSGSCRSSTIRTCFLRCPANWSQKTCEGTYKPYLENLQTQTLHSPPSRIKPAGLSIISGSASASPIDKSCSWIVLWVRFCVRVDYEHSLFAISGFGLFRLYFLLFKTEKETCPDCTAISRTEPNRNKLNLFNQSSGPSETLHFFNFYFYFGHSWPLNTWDNLTCGLPSSPANTGTYCTPVQTGLQSFNVCVLNNMDPQPSKESQSKTSSTNLKTEDIGECTVQITSCQYSSRTPNRRNSRYIYKYIL